MLWKKEKYLYSSIFFLIKVNFFLFPFRITFSHSVLLFFPPAFRTSLLCHSVLAIILKHQALISLTPGHTNAINISLLCMDQYPTSIMLWTDLIPASFLLPILHGQLICIIHQRALLIKITTFFPRRNFLWEMSPSAYTLIHSSS